MYRFSEKLITFVQQKLTLRYLCTTHATNNQFSKLVIRSSKLFKNPEKKIQKPWDTGMIKWKNTIMKQTLAMSKTFDTLEKRLASKKKVVGFLVSRGCHSWQKSTKLNFNFTNFAPCSLIPYKSTLTPSSFFSRFTTGVILEWDQKL